MLELRAAKRARLLAEEYGDEPLPIGLTASETDISLQLEWSRQASKFIELGFHKKLGLSEEQYLATLPKFGSQPEGFKGRFDIPVLVETRVPPRSQLELAGFEAYLEGLEVYDWPGDPKGYKTPGMPYVAWVQDGSKSLNKSVEEVRRGLAPDERGATLLDGTGLVIAHTELLKGHYIHLPGSEVGGRNKFCYAPYLSLGGDGPRLSYGWFDSADWSFGSASCGRQ